MTVQSDSYLKPFEAVTHAGDPDWLLAQRARALTHFQERGFPHRRVEAWRYSDLSRAVQSDYAPAVPSTQTLELDASFAALKPHQLIFVNGFLRPDLSDISDLPSGVSLLSLGDAVLSEKWIADTLGKKAPADDQAVQSLNLALAQDGYVLNVDAGVVLGRPLQIIYHSDSAAAFAAHLRHVIRLGEGARVDLIETHTGAGKAKFLIDHVTELDLAKNAILNQIVVQDEALDTICLTTQNVTLAQGAQLERFSFTLGAAFSRAQNFIDFAGEGAHAGLYTAFALTGTQLGDATTVMNHKAAHTTSMTQSKGVLDERAVGVFQGKVTVARGAQKVDGEQMSNALLLSRTASMNAKPELEIYADDVLCAHGSTIGELDQNALFYLRSRGVPEASARALLITAFLDEVIEKCPLEGAKDILRQIGENWFAREKPTATES